MTYTQAVALYVLGFAVFVLLVGFLGVGLSRLGQTMVARIEARDRARRAGEPYERPSRNTEPPP